MFQTAYNLSPADPANGAGCSVAYVATGSAGGGSQAMDRHLPVSLELDNDPLSRLFAQSDNDEDEDDDDDSFARAVAGNLNRLQSAVSEIRTSIEITVQFPNNKCNVKM